MSQPAANKPRIGPNGRPVRYFEMPDTFTGKLRVWRYIIYRRIVQITILVLFFGTFHWGWTLLGAPLLSGNLSASEVAGLVPLADPFAVLQILLTEHWLNTRVLLGAIIVLGFYTLVGGRTWCAWACPVNMVTDLANWLRVKLGITNQINV
ncbi:MAG TPA: 4Fe-4S binding protein, partial [Chromatiales bacterium]|nr:4Fe-4S binding protein [Chromatiales bacterium]